MKSYFLSPIGYIFLEASDFGLKKIKFLRENKPSFQRDFSGLLLKTEEELIEYFDGKRKVFDIPLQLVGTPFQIQVWEKTSQISYGETITYNQLAKDIKKPFSYRAVGNALGKNPIPIIIPCHRVVAKNGIGGFSAPIFIKKFLLNLEGVI